MLQKKNKIRESNIALNNLPNYATILINNSIIQSKYRHYVYFSNKLESYSETLSYNKIKSYKIIKII